MNYSPKINEEVNSKEPNDKLSSVKSRYLRETPLPTRPSQRELQKLVPFRAGVSVERNSQKEKEKVTIPPLVSRTASNILGSSASKMGRLSTFSQGINDKETSKAGNYHFTGTFNR